MNLSRKLKRAKNLINKDQYLEAKQLLNEILKSHPNNKEVKIALSFLEKNENFNSSIPSEIERDEILILFQSDQHEDALVKIKQAIISYPTDERLLYMEGCCYKELSRIDDALECFSRALEMKTDFHQVYNQMGSIFFLQGEFNNAIKQFNICN